jgi:hypothetical protein
VASPPGVLFPYTYLALIFVSALDVIFTYVVLLIGGVEVNPIANAVLHGPAEFDGLIAFKFAVVGLVVLLCEFIGRHAVETARRLSRWGVAISSFPVVWSSLLLIQHL